MQTAESSLSLVHVRLWGKGNRESRYRNVKASAVYNKTQYPGISLSCIFNDFLGDHQGSVLLFFSTPIPRLLQKESRLGDQEIEIVKTEPR